MRQDRREEHKRGMDIKKNSVGVESYDLGAKKSLVNPMSFELFGMTLSHTWDGWADCSADQVPA